MLSLKLMNAPNQMANETIIVSIEYLNSHPVRVSIDIKNNTVDIRKIGKKTLIRKLAKGDQVAAVGLFSSSSKFSFQG